MTTGSKPNWKKMIREATASRVSIKATRHEDGYGTASKPQRFVCTEDVYIVKFCENRHGDGKAIFTEQVVGRVGTLIEAALPQVALVEVSQELVDALIREKATLGLDYDPMPGIHHGSKVVGRDVTDRAGLQYEDENRERFGSLDVLYTWIPYTGDHQWIYEIEAPHRVYSVDHTPMFPGGSDWTVDTLNAAVSDVDFGAELASLGLRSEDRAATVAKLEAVTNQDIAEAVAQPIDEWGVTLDERCAIASYLATRRERVVAVCRA